MTHGQIRDLQDNLNDFTHKWVENITPLRTDGEWGPQTRKRLVLCLYWLGYGDNRKQVDHSTYNNLVKRRLLVRRLRHPKSGLWLPKEMREAGEHRRAEQRKHAHDSAQVKDGISTFDGKPVAAWLKPYLQWARDHGWQGYLVSGYRTPEHSQALCFGICGHPSCPGLCAGTSSNHTKYVKPGGALDVSDYIRFGQVIAGCPYSPRIFNALPNDRVHFSASGG